MGGMTGEAVVDALIWYGKVIQPPHLCVVGRGANLISATRSMGLKWNVNDSFIEEFKHTVNRVLSQSIMSCGCQKAYDMVEHIARHRIDGRRLFFSGGSFFLAKQGTGQ